MDGFLFFVTRALLTLIPLIAIAFACGLWLGRLLWFHWKKEYRSIEKDYELMHDHHEAAQSAVKRLEQETSTLQQRLDVITGETAATVAEAQSQLEAVAAERASMEQEMHYVKGSLAAARRNGQDMENLLRERLSEAQARINELTAQAQAAPAVPAPQAEPEPESEREPLQEEDIEGPELVTGELLPDENPPASEPRKPRKGGRRAA